MIGMRLRFLCLPHAACHKRLWRAGTALSATTALLMTKHAIALLAFREDRRHERAQGQQHQALQHAAQQLGQVRARGEGSLHASNQPAMKPRL
jgi:hypothetical protein